MTTNHKPLSIIAKCASCSLKTNLFVCSHCDEVICQKCVDKHQLKLNEILKDHWDLCKTKFLNLSRLSGIIKTRRIDCFLKFHIDLHDKDSINVENEIDQVRFMIDQRRMDLVHLIENEKNNLINKLEEYIQLNLSK